MFDTAIELLESFDYDENEIESLRQDARDALTLDSMSDDSLCFDSAMRAYHAR